MFVLDRSGVSVLGFFIHWYGVLIALGVLGAVLMAIAREKKLGLEKDTTLNLALICVPAGVVCARLYYVAFSWDYFSAHPGEILNLRSGGLAVYGSVIGGALAALIYARAKKVSFASLADLAAPGLVFGQAVGRWGNFFNQEAYGALVEDASLRFFPMAVYIDGSGWHYATFFYESIWCGLVCALLLVGERRKFFRRRGDVFCAYLLMYALERSLVEGLRTDSLYIGPLRVSQLLSLAAALAICVLLALRIKKMPLGLLPVGSVLALGLSLAFANGLLCVFFAALTLFSAAMLYSRYAKDMR